MPIRFSIMRLALRAVSCLCLGSLFCAPTASRAAPKARNVIFMVPDGMGPAYPTLTRLFARRPLAFDPFVRALVQTSSANSTVTDSSAAATAMATGFKINNNVVGITPDGLRPPSLLSLAREKGKATGVVVTTTVTHATPASFVAHQKHRSEEDAIARQYLGRVDVILGGGRDWFTPKSRGGRQPSRDLISEARAQNYQILSRRDELAGAQNPKMLGLFAPLNLNYALDRPAAKEPRLSEMTETALRVLSRDADGFFLLVEGSLIDYAGHANDPVALVHEVVDFEGAFQSALRFAQKRTDTLIIIAADHETGGLTIGREEGGYRANVPALSAARGTTVGAARDLEKAAAHFALKSPTERRAAAARIARRTLGFTPTEAEAQNVAGADWKNAEKVAGLFSPMISRRALLGWTTSYHTATDIVLYAYGPGATSFGGVMDNTDIARRVATAMGVRLQEAASHQGAKLGELASKSANP